MGVYKVVVGIEGREIDAIVRAGVPGTVELGHFEGDVRRPSHRIVFVPGQECAGPSAWVQIGKYDEAGELLVAAEGWVSSGPTKLAGQSGIGGSDSLYASIQPEDPASERGSECTKNVRFGAMACCTSKGANGCYVTCCNSCCADPTRCPGASCCG